MIRVLFETCLGMCMMKHGPKLPNLLLKFLGLNFVSPKLRKSITTDDTSSTSKCAKNNGSFFVSTFLGYWFWIHQTDEIIFPVFDICYMQS